MTTTYNLDLVFRARDEASGIIGGLLNSFTRIGQIAGGIIVSRALIGIADGLRDIAVSAIEATANVQRMQITLESLLAREYIYQNFEQGAVSATAYDQALQAVIPTADKLMDSLANIAILSPYTYESVTQTFRQAMAFGFASDEADLFTKATLNMASGIGASNDMLDRMAYNLAQIRLQGKVTALDIRQLALAGFDLTGVLQYVGTQMQVNIKDHKDFNSAIKSGAITWQDFTRLYAQYADTYFGKASERLARTLSGLKSTFQDVFQLTMPKVLGPAADSVTTFLNAILNDFISLRDSGLFEDVGARLQIATEKWVEHLSTFYNKFKGFIRLTTEGGMSMGQALAASGIVSPEIGEAINSIIAQAGALKEKWDELVASIAGKIDWPSIGDGIKFVAENFDKFAAVLAVIVAGGLLNTLVTSLSILASVILSLLSPMTLLIGALVLLYFAWTQNWGGIRDIVQSAVASVMEALDSLITFLGPLINVIRQNLPAAMAMLSTAAVNLIAVFKSIWAAIEPSIQRLVALFKDLWPQIVSNFAQSIEIFKQLAPVIGYILVVIVGIIVGILNAVINVIATVISIGVRLQEAFLGIVQGIINIFKGLFNVLAGIFTLDGQRILEGLLALVTGIWQILSNLFQAVMLIMAQPFAILIAIISGFVEGVIGFFQALYTALVGESIIPDMMNAIVLIITTAMLFVQSVFLGAIQAIIVAFQSLNDIVTMLVQGAIELLLGAIQGILSEMERLAAFVRGVLLGAFDAVRSAVDGLVGAVKSLAKALANLKLPSVFKPGSPSPFELALTGINTQMKMMNGMMNQFSNISTQTSSRTPALQPSAPQQNVSKEIVFNFKDTDLDLGTLAFALNRISDV